MIARPVFPPSRSRWLDRSPAASATIAIGAVLLLAGCGVPPSPQPQAEASARPATAFEHVHGLGLDPDTGSIYVATHVGLFEVPATADDRPLAYSSLGGPIAGRAQDTRGFTMADGMMWGSGHPDPADSATIPANLGLIRSADDAATWSSVSLWGEVDFHDIAIAPDTADEVTIYGYDSSRGAISISTDSGETWAQGATISARDLTVGIDGEVYATTAAGLMVSGDGARSFALVDGAPALYLVDAMPDRGGLVVFDTSDSIWVRDAAGEWRSSGPAPGTVEALTYSALPSPVIAIAGDRGISTSSDSGATWITRAQDVDGD